MALKELYHVVAASRAVKSGVTIREGQLVTLDSAGEVVAISNPAGEKCYGIAGDTKSTSQSEMPGVAAGWQNRASDYFDETKASAKMTVYHSGGEFATDQFANTITDSTLPMVALYSDANGVLAIAALGEIVAYLLTPAGAYISGVPGTDIDGDIALSGHGAYTAGVAGDDNEYIEIKLAV